jgi:hypothetical protein
MARTVAVALASLALIPAAAEASAKPRFPRTVTGTISGVASSSSAGTTVKESWTIKGVRFKLEHVRFVENTWTGFYKVTGGTVTFSERVTGDCTYSVDKTYALRPVMPKRPISTPFFLNRDMLGRDTYGGNITPNLRWNVTQTCTDPAGGEPTTEPVRVEQGRLFDTFGTGSRRFRIGKAMKGTYRYDDGEYGTTTYKWSLKARR